MSKIQYYEVSDGNLIRKKRTCPKCGDGVFLAEHKDRISCGSCGYTEFKKKEKPKKETVETKKPAVPDTGAPSLFEE
ncbi:MAG: 30S ribosomal protein S27ae [Thermoplasmata archaeon]|nr:MAG: 30S ribosomal protein S27ae [Thermoplasmata archaeon]